MDMQWWLATLEAFAERRGSAGEQERSRIALAGSECKGKKQVTRSILEMGWLTSEPKAAAGSIYWLPAGLGPTDGAWMAVS